MKKRTPKPNINDKIDTWFSGQPDGKSTILDKGEIIDLPEGLRRSSVQI